jgi:hypothetical protein
MVVTLLRIRATEYTLWSFESILRPTLSAWDEGYRKIGCVRVMTRTHPIFRLLY